MDVYLIPTGETAYALYCELPPPDPGDVPNPRSIWARAVAVFRRALAEGEHARQHPDAHEHRGRLRTAITRRLAEAVAEQRLLWQLRRQASAHLIHPDDLEGTAALAEVRRALAADRDKHRRWCIIDAGLTILSAPVALLPGPNFLAYYFIFRVVGHYLSWKGAQQGLATVAWSTSGSAPLTSLRTAWRVDEAARGAHIDHVASALGLARLALFLQRIACRPAS
jgi:hypothetical protein